MKLCFIAPSGYGKTTAVDYIEKTYDAKNIKIADFLYEVQNYIYGRMDIYTNGKQDGELLQFLGKKVREIDSTFLLRNFQNKVINTNNEIILNDDCRPKDYEYLKSLGFIFIKLDSYSRDRSDITKVDKKNTLEWQELPECDYVISNFGSIDEYYKNIDNLMERIRTNGKVLRYTNSK